MVTIRAAADWPGAMRRKRLAFVLALTLSLLAVLARTKRRRRRATTGGAAD